VVDARAFDIGPRDTAPSDGGAPDAVTPEDGAVPGDAGLDASMSCPAGAAGGALIAHYTFDADGPTEVLDSVGGHHGTVAEGRHCESGRCDTALCFDGTDPDVNHAVIPNFDDVSLREGAVEFFARVNRVGSFGLVSRDALGTTQPGHLTIMTSTDGHVVARLQVMGAAGPADSKWLCSEATVAAGRPFHVGLSWGGAGGLRLFLNHSGRLMESGFVVIDNGGAGNALCGPAGQADGVDGNSEPWYLGVYSGFRSSGMSNGLLAPLDGAIDEVRIYGTAMDFSGP